ncbi:hypothetical protein POTOM_029616 [Populus tomentosa]|uniref:Plastocyanin-like domain-containing protein n=1 Tax=Populus tomentosa TaxID=118781 RepID=A0A8X7Z781_POPTO|nr:hypothetical protein POTOM_029616 [Populus tomentosa]
MNAFDQCPPPDGKELANFDICSVAKNINGTSSNRIYSLWFNSTVGVVLQNANTVTANNSETHPWHLHRHDFWALGYGTGKYNMSSEWRKDNLVNQHILLCLNMVAGYMLVSVAITSVYSAQDQGIFMINHTKSVMKQIVLQLPLDEGDHTSSALNSMASTNDAEATGEENSRVGADDDEETQDVSALNTNREV